VASITDKAALGALSQGTLGLTLDELRIRLQTFPIEYLKDKSPETVGTYRRSLHEFERWVGNRPGAGCTLTSDTFVEYKRYLQEVRQLSALTVSTYLTAVRRFCDYLVSIGRLKSNPASSVKGNPRPATHSRHVLTEGETRCLMESLDETTQMGKRDVAIVYLMLFAGLSGVEIVRANLEDLDRTLMGDMLRVQGKGRRYKDQTVMVEPEVVQKVENYLKTRKRRRPKDPLLVSHGRRNEGKRLTTRSIRNRVSSLLESAGIVRQGLSPHSLTHTAPLLWLGKGMSAQEVKNRMRHGTMSTTEITLKKKGFRYRIPTEQ